MSNEKTTDEAATQRRKQLKKARRMLRELSQLAEHSSLTGALRSGASEAVHGYNQVLAFIAAQGVDLGGMFAPLPAEASFDSLGVSSRLLRGYIDGELEADEECETDVHVLVGDKLNKVRDIGNLIREHLPDFIKTEEAPPVTVVMAEGREKSHVHESVAVAHRPGEG